MVKKSVLGVAAVFIIIFIIYSPRIDQIVAAMPFNSATNKFYGEVSCWCNFIYYLVAYITVGLLIILFAGIIYSSHMPHSKATRRRSIIILLILLLVPGLVVNVIFKNNWGRPRPYQVIRDHQTFAPVWQANFHTPNDNSFPSGHASIGFFLGVPFLVFGYRRRGIIIGMLCGILIGLIRILQGGHYLSDILFAAVFVWIVAELVVYLANRLEH